MSTPNKAIAATLLVFFLAQAGYANWADTFDDGQFGLGTWQFLSYPQVAGTFAQAFLPGDDGNSYLVLGETSSVSKGGAAFGAGFGSTEVFADVRMGAVVNVAGDASHNYHGLGVRMSYLMSDGTTTPAPGLVASGYVMHVNWENGPANLAIDIEKVVNLQNIMRTDFDVVVPNLGNARSYYAELEAVGAGPVYVTGRLYEYKDGPLVAKTDTMVDTNGNDPWEDANKQDGVFKTGVSGIFAQNERAEPAGFYTTFDDVSSVSDGPAAVAIAPVDGAGDVSVLGELQWVEAAFATGRRLWFGLAGQMQAVDPAPVGTTYDPGRLQPGSTYEWRVDQIGPAGVVEGHTWHFTTGDSVPVDDFEFYAGAVDKLHGQTIPYPAEYTVLTLREPHGVTAHIVPWNYPMQILGRSVGASLAAGNACVVKPAEDACLSVLRVAEMAADCGLPPGGRPDTAGGRAAPSVRLSGRLPAHTGRHVPSSSSVRRTSSLRDWARAMPRKADASSTVPYASGRSAYLGTRSRPSTPVNPSSPTPVYHSTEVIGYPPATGLT